jgi:hypothetical protein
LYRSVLGKGLDAPRFALTRWGCPITTASPVFKSNTTAL